MQVFLLIEPRAKIQCFVTKIILKMLQPENEAIRDTLTYDFRGLLLLCEQYSSLNTSTLLISCGVELVSTVFFIAANCRDPEIRIRAMSILTKTDRREPKWYSVHAAAILQWLRNVEEGDEIIYCAADVPASRTIILHKLEYFHDLDQGQRRTSDPILGFQTPSWIRVQYTHLTEPANILHQWINVKQSPDIATYGWQPSEDAIAFAFDVEEPLMPSTAAMILLAYRTGRDQNSQEPKSDLFVCDAFSQDPASHDCSKECILVVESLWGPGSREAPKELCSIRNLAPEKMVM